MLKRTILRGLEYDDTDGVLIASREVNHEQKPDAFFLHWYRSAEFVPARSGEDKSGAEGSGFPAVLHAYWRRPSPTSPRQLANSKNLVDPIPLIVLF